VSAQDKTSGSVRACSFDAGPKRRGNRKPISTPNQKKEMYLKKARGQAAQPYQKIRTCFRGWKRRGKSKEEAVEKGR